MRPFIAALAVLAALLLAAAPAPARGDDGIGARIINGRDAPPGAWPSIAYLVASRGGQSWACGGSVIAPRVILTAAHCAFNASGQTATSGFARPGVLLSADSSTQLAWAFMAWHPSYDAATYTFDVALVELAADTTAPPMPLIAPWQDGLIAGGAAAAIAGWGRTVNGGPGAGTLREAAVPIIADDACAGAWGTLFQPASMVCAGDLAAGIDTCNGDSGGPLALMIGGTRTLVGDTSWGSQTCANGSDPGVYGRISAFRSWILDGGTRAHQLVRDHVAAQTATAQGLALTSTGPDVTLTWGVTSANWTTTGFRVTLNGSTETVSGPTAARTVAIPAGGAVTATVEPVVTLGTAAAATISATPTPTRAPVVSAAVAQTPRVDSTLTATAASDDPWGGAVGYQWRLNGVDIAGATDAAYRPLAAQAGRLLSLRVAAANAAGTGEAIVVVGRVQRAPQVRTGRVPVTGRAVVGGRLTAGAPTVGGYPRPTATYRFRRDGRVVQSGSARTYRVRERDRGATITGTVIWRNAAGTVTRRLAAVRIAV